MNTDLNLLPNVAKFQAIKIRLKQRVKMGVIVFAGIWIGLVLAVALLLVVFKAVLARSEKEYVRAQNEYASLSEDIVINQLIKYKAKVVGNVLKERFEYGKAFQEIGKLFTNIKIEKFDLRENGSLTLSGMGAGVKAIDEVEQKVTSINNGELELFKAARLTTIAFTNNNWRFTMEVTLK